MSKSEFRQARKNVEVTPENLCALSENSRRHESARREFEQAIDVVPGFVKGRRSLAMLDPLFLKDKQAAARQFAAILELNPADPDARNQLDKLRQEGVEVELVPTLDGPAKTNSRSLDGVDFQAARFP